MKFLIQTHEDFFKKKEGTVIAVEEDIKEYLDDMEFKKQFKDTVELRTMVYYKTRFEKKNKSN
ncbi:hypothetical protein J1C67_16550 [Clostridium gasigenes]|uniref:hypothetical protein n=1 Tax=Clostridium gasigenes TaxID=94869 RepID=UPI0014383741|nr:hypothetical protein [Clostridium gasigenes]NKF05692.1 hypothetical protein [Clostridium gasigenes]QSW19126.1 hypothetical protein J1C67_16550 [Clostridium gasigenes]